ncbi:MAG: hypothetical protein IPK22_07065 [Verrucomicrobiaceae bacterium]|nr:hypothetical protein [Verrucomicrobiaceae bacterium]
MTLAPAFLAGNAGGIGVRHETVGRVDAGRVDERIGHALFEHFIERGGHAGGVGHVADDGKNVFRQRSGFLKRIERASEDEGLRACVRETLRRRLSHAAATAGDDHDFVCPSLIHARRLSERARGVQRSRLAKIAAWAAKASKMTGIHTPCCA